MRHIIDKRTFPFNFILKDKNIINKCIQGKDENYFPFCKISHPSHLLHNGREREREGLPRHHPKSKEIRLHNDSL